MPLNEVIFGKTRPKIHSNECHFGGQQTIRCTVMDNRTQCNECLVARQRMENTLTGNYYDF